MRLRAIRILDMLGLVYQTGFLGYFLYSKCSSLHWRRK